MATASMRAVHLASSFGAAVADPALGTGSSSVFGDSLRCSSSSSAGGSLRLRKTVSQPVNSRLLAPQLVLGDCIVVKALVEVAACFVSSFSSLFLVLFWR
jgi:hypothetical protein